MTPRRSIRLDADHLLAALVGALYLLEILTEARFDGDRGVSVVVALRNRVQAVVLAYESGVVRPGDPRCA